MPEQQHFEQEKLTLGYWPIRGLGQVARHLLSYLNFQFTEVQYTDGQKWFGQDKKNLGFDFPNLPYLTHGDFKLTELDAICRYVIEISGQPELLGKSNQDKALITSIYGVVQDCLQQCIKLFYDKEYESKLKQVWQKIKPKLDYLNNFIKDRNTSLDYLSYVDFIIAELICHYVPKLYPEETKEYLFIKNIREHVDGLEGVMKYYQRPDAIHVPHMPEAMAVIKF